MPQKPRPRGERPLKPQMVLFAHEFCVDRKGAAAAVRAGYSKKTARQIAYELLQHPGVKALIDANLARLTRKADLSAEAVLNQWKRLALPGLEGLLEWTAEGVKVRKDAKPTDEQLVAIAAMLKGAPGERAEIDTLPMRDALEALSRHFNLFKYPLDLTMPKPDGDEPTVMVVGRYSDVIGRFRRGSAAK